MNQHQIKRAFPNEQFQIILEFYDSVYRTFNCSLLSQEKGWKELAYPQHIKNFTVLSDRINWPAGGDVSSDYLYENSREISQEQLQNQVIRLAYKNQAPTSEDKLHHVYGVYLAPYSPKPFRVGESIGGGIADRGGGFDFSIPELLAWSHWQKHFELSGCMWAISLVQLLALKPAELLDALIKEACIRSGMGEIKRGA